MSFEQSLDDAATFLREHENIVLIAHADADGICAAAILSDVTKNITQTRFLLQVSTPALEKLAQDITNPIVFVDMGSSHLGQIEKSFTQQVLVIDHHQETGETKHLTVNPVQHGLDGTRDISAAGIAWEIASRLVDANDLIPIALIGAQADNQEPFAGYNKKILDLGVEEGLIETEQGARLFGRESKPLTKLVAYSYDLKIPGLKGNVNAAGEFLDSLDIPWKNRRERYWNELTGEERARIDKALIEESPPHEEITHYRIPDMPRGPLRDTREASSLLNACGRLGDPEIGVRILLDGEVDLARDAQRKYREAVRRAHEWYESHAEAVTRKDGLVIICAGFKIPASVAGTLCSVLVRGKEVPPGTVVVCLARNDDGTETTKVSSRVLDGEKDLAAWLSAAASATGGEGGGHAVAAGAIVPTKNELEFIKQLKETF